jgi:hypothetical protein
MERRVTMAAPARPVTRASPAIALA